MSRTSAIAIAAVIALISGHANAKPTGLARTKQLGASVQRPVSSDRPTMKTHRDLTAVKRGTETPSQIGIKIQTTLSDRNKAEQLSSSLLRKLDAARCKNCW